MIYVLRLLRNVYLIHYKLHLISLNARKKFSNNVNIATFVTHRDRRHATHIVINSFFVTTLKSDLATRLSLCQRRFFREANLSSVIDSTTFTFDF
jgi:hypothetical protein